MSTILLLAGCCSWFCLPWLLWSLLSFLLGALLYHWLFGGKKYQEQIEQLTIERDGYHAKAVNFEKDLASCKYQLDEANKEIASLKAALSHCESDKAGLKAQLAVASEAGTATGDAALGFAAGAMTGEATARGTTNYTTLLGSDNLQIVEGIGPKIDGLLKEAGIGTWGALAAASVDTLQGILDKAGSSFRLAKPDTWPRQAELAHAGQWDELIEYQKFLDTGVESKGDFENPSKVEKMIAKLLGFSTNPDDLKIVEGIGPKIESLLKDAGIINWSDLAAASTDRLQEILAAAGERYRLADPSTWAKQASLAAEGKWDELNAYQEFLDGGREPDQA
ncbi:MAG: helix-hairpin-helix domain-containing protein [Saprospiraceae bacterium]